LHSAAYCNILYICVYILSMGTASSIIMFI
jgi:hypothetical protein